MDEQQHNPKQPDDIFPSAGADEKLPTALSDITNPTSAINSMEVHHHPHVEKKNFKEYLLEGLMIFLAVTMGFFAEGLREHIGDKAKENEYLSSLVEELKYDTTQYNIVLKKIAYLRPLLDSLVSNVNNAAQYNYIVLGKWNTPINETRLSYMPTLLTIQQLKSSGNLRLIQSKEGLKKIMEYETFVQGTMQHEATVIQNAIEKVYDLEDAISNEAEFNEKTDKNMQDSAAQFSIENGSLYNMPLVVKDPIKLNQFANSFINYKSRNWGYSTNTNTAKKMATDLITVINKEYHLDNE